MARSRVLLDPLGRVDFSAKLRHNHDIVDAWGRSPAETSPTVSAWLAKVPHWTGGCHARIHALTSVPPMHVAQPVNNSLYSAFVLAHFPSFQPTLPTSCPHFRMRSTSGSDASWRTFPPPFLPHAAPLTSYDSSSFLYKPSRTPLPLSPRTPLVNIMTDRHGDNTSSDLAFDPSGQGQGQGKHNVDPTNRENLAASEIRNEGRGPTQGQGQGQEQYDRPARTSYFGNRPGGDPSQTTNDTGGGQDRGQHGHQGQLRQDEQTNVPYGGGGRDPRQGGHKDQVVGDPQGRFNTGAHGTSTGAGPGARPGDDDIRGDGGFRTKPPMPQRVMGAVEMMVGKATGNVAMYEHGQQQKTGGH